MSGQSMKVVHNRSIIIVCIVSFQMMILSNHCTLLADGSIDFYFYLIFGLHEEGQSETSKIFKM